MSEDPEDGDDLYHRGHRHGMATASIILIFMAILYKILQSIP